MRRFLWIWCMAGIGVAALYASAAAEEANPEVLVSQLVDRSDRAASRAAVMELRQSLRSGTPETVSKLQGMLCQRIAATDDPRSVRRICLVLAVAPCDEAIMTVADRLEPGLPPAAQLSMCCALRYLVSQYVPADAGTTSFALSRLEHVMRDKRLPLPVVDLAVMATGALGSPGFDLLMELHNEAGISRKIANSFYTALSETGDARVLPVLRAAIEDGNTREGRRIQAVHAIGQMFGAASRRGQSIDPAEAVACAGLLRQHLDDGTPGQLFSVALRALGKIVDIRHDPDLRRATLEALTSESRFRREGAFQVLYQSDTSLDEPLLDFVRSAAESDGDLSVRVTARALLEKHDAHESPE